MCSDIVKRVTFDRLHTHTPTQTPHSHIQTDTLNQLELT